MKDLLPLVEFCRHTVKQKKVNDYTTGRVAKTDVPSDYVITEDLEQALLKVFTPHLRTVSKNVRDLGVSWPQCKHGTRKAWIRPGVTSSRMQNDANDNPNGAGRYISSGNLFRFIRADDGIGGCNDMDENTRQQYG